MFNKNKIDRKIRYQSSGFKKRLSEQRNYKRTARTIPQTDWAVFLSKIGLGSWQSRALTGLGLFILIYLVFIPNFLFVKNITITGVDATSTPAIINTVNSFLEKKLPLPQKNLLLLSKSALAEYLLKYNQKVLSVLKISKKFPNTLIINITQRTDRFLLKTPSFLYSVSNDGLVTNQFITDATGTLPSGLTLIKINSEAQLNLGQKAFSPETVQFLQAVSAEPAKATKIDLDYFQIADLQTPDISAYLKNGSKIIFGLDTDPKTALTRLSVLFGQLSGSDRQKLFYVDMRSLDKAYVCLKGAPCVKDVNFSGMQGTSTPNNISN